MALPRLVFLTAWEVAGMREDPHPVVAPDGFYMTPETRAAVRGEAMDLLAEQGLAAAGRVTAEFHDLLAVLTGWDRQVYGWSAAAGASAGVAVLAYGRSAVRLAADDEVVLLEPVPAGDPADALLAALPEVSAAAVPVLTVRQDEYAAVGQAQPDLWDSTPSAAERMRDLMAKPRTRVHQLYAATRAGRTPQRTLVDLDGPGRVLVHADKGVVTLRPGTPEAVREALRTG